MIEHPSVREKNARRMKANKLKINNEYVYEMFTFANIDEFETNPGFDLNKPKNDLISAISDYEAMLIDLGEAMKSFSVLLMKVPEEWRDKESKNLKSSFKIKANHFISRVNVVAQLYEDIVGFAANIIKELNGIVFEERNFPWDILDLIDKKELLEMVYIRLIACTRLLEFCDNLRQELSPYLIEVIKFSVQIHDQSELFKNNLENLGDRLSEKVCQINPTVDKLTHSIVFDTTRGVDEFGRYEFNKWLHRWKIDITNWKLCAYRGAVREDIVLVSEVVITRVIKSLTQFVIIKIF